MARKKLIRFEEIKSFPNVFSEVEDFPKLKNVTLELGCGKGAYVLALAKIFPKRNFVGVDRKGERIWVGAKQATDEGIENVFFIKDEIRKLPEYFKKRKIEEIWVTFPDPHPANRNIKRRLISPIFLSIYRELLKKNGVVHLKTDSEILVEYAKELKLNFEEIREDIYGETADISDILSIQTDFENKHLKIGRKIHYLRFTP